MHEAQQPQEQEQKQEVTAKKARRSTPRPYKFFATVRHRQVDLETNKPAEPEFLEFPDKAAMREKLSEPKYEGAEVRIIRGYEMVVKARRSISVN
jgi:hypothetical protein